jgi:hypothetical protein
MKGKQFKTLSDWISFKLYIQQRNRYILDFEYKAFIDRLLLSAQKREQLISSREKFYRARIGVMERGRKQSIFKTKHPYSKKEMKNPPPEKAIEGRINPKGISYLYLSSDLITAIAETRPWVDELISVAECTFWKDLKVINMIPDSEKKLCNRFKEKPTAQEKENIIWHDIEQDFSKPIIDHVANIEHVPTQFIAEAFKNAGYEGIKYKSSLSNTGYNLVVFDGWNIIVKKCYLQKVSGVAYSAVIYKNLWIPRKIST